jgi:hypothetical protein
MEREMENERILVKVRTAARMIDRSPSALYEDLKKGLIPFVKIGNSIRISVRVLERFAETTGEEE